MICDSPWSAVLQETTTSGITIFVEVTRTSLPLTYVRGWQGGVQQLFQGRGSRRRDTGDRCQGGGISSQQVVQAAKART